MEYKDLTQKQQESYFDTATPFRGSIQARSGRPKSHFFFSVRASVAYEILSDLVVRAEDRGEEENLTMAIDGFE